MSGQQSDRVRRLADLTRRHRRCLWGATAAVAVYAVSGFFLAPWLVKKNAIEFVQESFGAELRLAKVAINPFVLSLRIEGLELDDPTGTPFARIEEFFVNFQLSSLFRWAWTFDEFFVTSPQVYLARDDAGAMNVARFEVPTTEPAASADAAGEQELPRLFVFDFKITDGVVQWNDEIPVEPVETRFGPVTVQVSELNTLPERSGEQAVVIATETAGTLSWNGSLQLNPLKSAGHAAIKGSHFPLTSAYFRHEAGLDIVEGDADVELDYSVDSRPDGGIMATVDNFDVAFRDVLVRTFSPSGDAATIDRDVLNVPTFRLSGGTLRWPERVASIASLTIDDVVVSLFRDEGGMLNVARDPSPGPGVAEQAGPAAAGDGGIEATPPSQIAAEPDWQLTLDTLAINRLAVGLEDHSVVPHADIGIKSLDLSVSDISNASGTKFPTSLNLLFRTSGSASLDGHVTVLPDLSFEFDTAVTDASLAAVHPYLKPLADVNLDSGSLNIDGHISHTIDEPLSFTGDVEVVDFLITETDEGSRLGSWKRFRADNVAFSVADNSLEISEIGLEQPYGDILIAEDGSVNLGRIEKSDGSEGSDETEEPEFVASPEDSTTQPVLAVTVGRVAIADGAADFADRSLPVPFAAAIAELNGNLTTIATTSSEPSAVSLEGKVDEFGLVRVSGNVTPLDPALNTDIKVAFQNVEMPKFSAYSIPLAGREIASGRLDLDLGYTIAASELVGENNIVLRDFELGGKVEHPGAMSLPLGLAVALLKGADGKIDIDLPVRGNVDDPEFRYGGLIWKALTNLIIKIVASPFAMLANLVGAESSDLEYVNFTAGRADLTPPEMEKIVKLVEALALRPELALEISGVVDREADGLALRTAKLELAVEERIASLVSAGEDEDMYAEQQREALEQLFSEQAAADDPEPALQELRARYTTQVESENGDRSEERFDAVAYSNELRRQLIGLQPVTDAELDALASERGNNAHSAILSVDPGLQARLRMAEVQEATGRSDDGVRMKVTLTTDIAE